MGRDIEFLAEEDLQDIYTDALARMLFTMVAESHHRHPIIVTPTTCSDSESRGGVGHG